MLMGSAIIPMAVEEPRVSSRQGLDAACRATPWLVTVGFSLTFATLHAKEVRVAKVMRKNMRKVKVTASQVMKPAAALVGINVVLMAIWTAVAPFEYRRTPVNGSTDEFGRPTQSYGSCELPRDPDDPRKTWWVGIMFVALIATVNFGKLSVAMFQVYKTRHIETEYSEAKFVGLSMVSIVQAWLIGIPLVLAARGSPTGLFIIVSALLFIMCQSILDVNIRAEGVLPEGVEEEADPSREGTDTKERDAQLDDRAEIGECSGGHGTDDDQFRRRE